MNALTQIDDRRFFSEYMDLVPADPYRLWQSFVHFKNLPTLTFSSKASAVFSSQIEGSSIELDTFLKGVPDWWHAGQKERQRIEDLTAAYEFARGHAFNEKNLLKAHSILAANIGELRDRQKGEYRIGPISIVGTHGLLYQGAPAREVEAEMNVIFSSIGRLKGRRLNVRESFYHAGLAHLVFEQIHPFADGNGRVGRLLEKWLMASYLGSKAWKLPTEEYYSMKRDDYYDRLNLGPSYSQLDHRGVPAFLTLPVEALQFGRDRLKKKSSH